MGDRGEDAAVVRLLAERICGVMEPGGEGDWMAYRDAAEAVLDEFEQVGHAREYVEPGVGGIAAVYDVGDEPPWEYGTSAWTVPVFRLHIGSDAR